MILNAQNISKKNDCLIQNFILGYCNDWHVIYIKTCQSLHWYKIHFFMKIMIFHLNWGPFIFNTWVSAVKRNSLQIVYTMKNHEIMPQYSKRVNHYIIIRSGFLLKIFDLKSFPLRYQTLLTCRKLLSSWFN